MKKRIEEIDIIELLMPQLMDRMSKLYAKNKEYKECFDREEKLYEHLKEMLSEETARELELYFHATIDTNAITERLAYVQGMKDMLALLKALS